MEQVVSENLPKHEAYTVAWERMNEAIKQGFFLEAVAIQESIIFDRLRSFVAFIEGVDIDNRAPLKKIVRRWQDALNRIDNTGGVYTVDFDLVLETLSWVDDRNLVIHTIVRSQPGEPTRDVNEFLKHAEKTALDGKRISRQISDWFRRQKAMSRNQSTVSDVT